MADNLAGLLTQARNLPPEAQAELAWKSEIARRTAELDSGAVSTLAWEDVHHHLYSRLKR